MSFVDGFYGFSIDIADASREVYQSVRIKVPKHPDESLQYLAARVIAWCYRYAPGLEFSQGLFSPKDPTMWRHDVVQQITAWAEVGLPSEEKLQRALRRSPEAEFAVYFTQPEQIQAFCHYLRGSTSNWISPVAFFLIPPAISEALAAKLGSNNRLTFTTSDGTVFLSGKRAEESFDLTFELPALDIWAEFQASLKSEPLPQHSKR